MNIEIYFDNKAAFATTDCYIVSVDYQGKRSIAKPMVLEFVPFDEAYIQEPSLKFGPNVRAEGFFEALVEGLARVGYKPENNDVGELKATKIHLEDLRNLVFKSRPKA